MWMVTTTVEFDRWFETRLSDGEREEVTAVVNLLKLFGPMLKRPHADTLNGSKYANMKELRAKTSGSELRIAFAFDTERQAVLLTAGNKSGVGQKVFYEQLIDRADRLFEAHLAKLAAAAAAAKKTDKGKRHGKDV
jgi:hypothetical protein